MGREMKGKTPLPILERHSRLKANNHNDAKGGEHAQKLCSPHDGN